MTPLIVHPLAENDIVEAFAWYEERVPGLGVRFHDAVNAAFRKIQEHPQSFPVFRTRLRKLNTDGFPYGIYFVIEDAVVRVVAVVHGARHRRVLRGRL